MVLSDRWRISDDELEDAIDAIKNGGVPNMAKELQERTDADMAEASRLQKELQQGTNVANTLQPLTLASPCPAPRVAGPRVPQLGLPLRPDAEPTQAAERRGHVLLRYLRREDTIACSATGKRAAGAPSKHIKVYIEIPAAKCLMSVWVDPDFPVDPPACQAGEFSGAKPSAALSPRLSARKDVLANAGAAAILSTPRAQKQDVSMPEARCLKHVIEDVTGVPVWEQSLRSDMASLGTGPTLRECRICHGCTVILRRKRCPERDARLFLRRIAQELQRHFPKYSFREEVLLELKDPIVESHVGYQKALDSISKAESIQLVESVEGVEAEYLCEGRLMKASAISASRKEPDELMQPQTDPGTEDDPGPLLEAAAEAQDVLRATIAPVDAWSVVQDKNDRQEHTPAILQEHSAACKRETRKSRFADYILDPGIKQKRRIDEKVRTKYLKEYGSRAYARVRDIARMAFQYTTCSRLLQGLEILKKSFNVVEIENRFSAPTALGWRDITVLIKVPLSGCYGDYHIGEIQLSHVALGDARLELHKHFRAIRSLLPKVCHVEAADMNRVQQFILDSLESKANSSQATSSPRLGAKADDELLAERLHKQARRNNVHAAAWVTPKWHHQYYPRFFAEPVERRQGPQPDLLVSIVRPGG